MTSVTTIPRGVKTAAKEARRFIQYFHGPDVYGMCCEWANECARLLTERGIAAVVVRGRFRCDSRHVTLGDDPYRPRHHWVEVGDLVIDGTATQFNDALDERMPPVFIGRSPRYLKE